MLWEHAAQRQGWQAPPINTRIGGASHDLTVLAVSKQIENDIRAGHYDQVHFGPPCASFSHMMLLNPTICSRSRLRPMGRTWNRPLSSTEAKANRILSSCLCLARACDECRIPWTWESPRRSLQWATRGWKALFASHDAQHEAVFDWCRYDRPWRKSTCLRGRSEDAAAIQIAGDRY